MDNPNTISRGSEGISEISEISSTPSHSKSLSSEILRSPEDKRVDDKIQEVLFISESEKELTEIILDFHKRVIDTSALVTQEDKEEFWEVVTSKLLLEKESLDKLKELDPFEVLLKIKAGLPLPNWSSIVSGPPRPNNPPHNSSSPSFSTIPKATTVPFTMAIIVPPPPIAPARYAPLVLPIVLHDPPSKYAARIQTWGSG